MFGTNAGECNQEDINMKYFRLTPEDKRCFTWNYNGNFSNAKNRVEFKLKMMDLKQTSFMVYVHDHKESPLIINTQILLGRVGTQQKRVRKHTLVSKH